MVIKKNFVNIKQNVYPKIYDQGTSQKTLLSAMDYEKGKLNIVVLKPKDQNKVTNISIDLNVVHPIDKMDLHRKLEKC